MPPPLLVDLSRVDTEQVIFTQQQVYEMLPHRHEFMLIDGVCHFDPEAKTMVAWRDIRPDDWWFRGHVPGRPLLPGVLMIEMAGHVSAVLAQLCGVKGFIGLGGVDACKFRETVTAPSRLLLLATARDQRARRIISGTQGVVAGRLVFEADITGMVIQ